MNELTKQIMCIQMRSGVELWIERDRVEKLQSLLENLSGHKFINFDNQTINTADIVGIFSGATMEELTRKKNGQWRCKSNTWHDKGEKCTCVSLEDKKLMERREVAIAACSRGCRNGYRLGSDPSVMIVCECVRDLK